MNRKLFRMFKVIALVLIFLSISVPAMATGGSTSGNNEAEQLWTNIIEFLAKWIGRIGLVIAFVGAINFANGIRNDDGDGKAKGIKWIASGLIIFAITLSLDLFGIV